jgi:hypothetical protein
MGYLLAGLLVLLIVGTAVTLVVRAAQRQGRGQGARAADDPGYGKGLPGSDTGILATDRSSPLGDTSEHSGEHSGGETVSDPETEGRGAAGSARSSPRG